MREGLDRGGAERRPGAARCSRAFPIRSMAMISEGVACAKAGAAIVHMHAYDGGGPQTFDWQVYARIIEGIRNEVDVVVYPWYPAIGAASG